MLCEVSKTDYAVYHQVTTKFGSSKKVNKKLCMVGYGVKNEVKQIGLSCIIPSAAFNLEKMILLPLLE